MLRNLSSQFLLREAVRGAARDAAHDVANDAARDAAPKALRAMGLTLLRNQGASSPESQAGSAKRLQ